MNKTNEKSANNKKNRREGPKSKYIDENYEQIKLWAKRGIQLMASWIVSK